MIKIKSSLNSCNIDSIVLLSINLKVEDMHEIISVKIHKNYSISLTTHNAIAIHNYLMNNNMHACLGVLLID